MPITYEIDPTKGVVLSSWTGTITDEEVLDFGRQLYRDERFDPAYRNLADLTGMDGSRLTSRAIRSLSAANRFSSTARRAFVVGNELAFGFTRMYQAEAEFNRVGMPVVFRDKAKALDWLNEGLPPERHIGG